MTIHLKEISTATPEQFVAALTDFGPGGVAARWRQRRAVSRCARPGADGG